MTVIVTKTFTTTCSGALSEAIELNAAITPTLEQIISNGGSTNDFHFSAALSAAENTELDTVLAGWVCPVDNAATSTSDVAIVNDTSPPDPDVIWSSEQIQIYLDAKAAAVHTHSEYPIFYSDTQTYGPGDIKTITLPTPLSKKVVHIFTTKQENIGARLISPAGEGWDPGNVSSTESNINNGVTSDLTYNNSSVGNTAGMILGIDMGSPVEVGSMKRWDYSNSYYDREWEFIGTDDATAATYTVIFDEEQDEANDDVEDPFEETFTPRTFRYWGWRCVESYNSNYTISKEIELYSPGTATTVEVEVKEDDVSYFIIDDSRITIQNRSDDKMSVKVIIIGVS